MNERSLSSFLRRQMSRQEGLRLNGVREPSAILSSTWAHKYAARTLGDLGFKLGQDLVWSYPSSL